MRLNKGTDPVIQLLRRIPGLGTLPDKILAPLVPLVDRCHVEPGDRLTLEGHTGREAFIVVDGQASVIVNGERVASIGPGGFIGEMALLDHRPRSATVRADTPMDLLVVSVRTFPALIQHPAVLEAMTGQVADRLRAASKAHGSERSVGSH